MFEAYSVAIKLSLINNVTSGLLAISKNLQSTHMDAERLQEKLSSIGKQMALGGTMFAGGLMLGKMLEVPLEEAKKYELALTRFKQMNLGASVNADADAMARHAHAFGTSATQMMDTIRDLHAAFGNYEEAKHFAPVIASLNAANSAIYGKGHEIDEHETKSLARVIEMRGGTVNQASFERELDLMQRMKNATGGVLNAKTLMAFMSTAGTAGRSMSDEGLSKMSGLIIEMGGSRAGTALMSGYQNLVAGRTTKKAMAELADLGLAQLSEVASGRVGGSRKTTTVMKSILGEDQLKHDFVGWIGDVLLPQLKRKGITSQDSQLKVINDILSNRTGSNAASITATQLSVMLKDAANVSQAHGVQGTLSDAKKTQAGQLADMHAKWNDALLALGTTILPLATKAVRSIIPVLQSFSEWATNNTGTLKLLVGGLIGLSGILVAGGLINMVSAAWQGFVLLRGALGGMPAMLAAANSGMSAWKIVMSQSVGQIGMLQTVFAAFAAYQVGHMMGTWLNDNVISPLISSLTGGKSSSLGDWLYHAFHSNDKYENGRPDITTIRPGGGKPMVVHVPVHIDGRQVAKAVTPVFTYQLGSGLTTGGIDQHAGLQMPGIK